MTKRTYTIKAYKVTECDEGTGGIVFARLNAEARRWGASEFGDGEWDYVECRRAPEFDQFAPGPVPELEMWRRGWWFECSCGSRIDGDFGYCEDTDKPRGRQEPFQYRGKVYCSPWCRLSSVEHAAERRADRKMAIYLAREALPEGCEVLDEDERSFNAGRSWDYVPVETPEDIPSWRRQTRRVEYWHASFRFPGSQYAGTWKQFRDGRPPEISVCRGDLSAWESFRGLPQSQPAQA